jgi:hypothetical protein
MYVVHFLISIILYYCYYYYYINKNVTVRLFKILNLRNFFADCFEILTQRCIRIRACFYIPVVQMSHL